MGSQKDLDQGGTFREWVRTYLGPSVGWVYLPASNILSIIAGGTTTVALGNSLVIVNVNAAVTLILPTTIHPSVPAGVQPYPFSNVPITMVDVGGYASAANPIILNPASGAETIMGLASIQITASFGAVSLRPSSTLKGWTSWAG